MADFLTHTQGNKGAAGPPGQDGPKGPRVRPYNYDALVYTCNSLSLDLSFHNKRLSLGVA